MYASKLNNLKLGVQKFSIFNLSLQLPKQDIFKFNNVLQ